MWRPYIVAHSGNIGLMPAIPYKGDATPLPDWTARAKKTIIMPLKTWLRLPPLILVANLASISNNTTTTAAVAYFWFRAAHNLFYIVDLLFSRSLTFTGGWLAQL